MVQTSRLSSKVHHWSLNIGNSCKKHMMSFIAKLNLSDVMLIDRPVKSQPPSETTTKTSRNRILEKQTYAYGNDQNGNKLRTYRTYKSQFQTEHYDKLNMSRNQRKVLAKFRSCNLPLEIEKGRYTRPKTPLNDRICKFCKSKTTEDETQSINLLQFL